MSLRERLEAKVRGLLPDANEIDKTVVLVQNLVLEIADMVDDAQEDGFIELDINILVHLPKGKSDGDEHLH